jgi:hypothetical protein
MRYSRLKPEHRVILDSSLTELERKAYEMTREERIKAVEELTETYTMKLDYILDSRSLERMANLILHEELSNSHPDKITREEYPIMSERQLKVRTEGKERKRTKTGTVTVEVPLEHASNVASDGNNYTQPTRSYFNPR